ncbi:MAG: hypothetical protein ACOZAR_03485 [Patescibacteria group bacterium]
MKKISLFLLPIVFAGILAGCSLWGSSNENSDQAAGDQTVVTEPINQGDNQNIDSPVNTDPVGGMYVVTNPADVLEKAKKSANLANEKARKWQSDAKLILLSTNYFSSLNDEGVIDKFIYTSDINTELYFSIDITRSDQKFTRTLIYRDDYRLKSGVLPIPIKYWKITYAQALEKADMLGGYQFRKDHPNYQVSQMLSLADGKNLAWYIVYSAPGSDQSFRITIDSSTGEQIL